VTGILCAQDSLLLQEYEIYYAYVDSLERHLHYDSGRIALDDLATIDLPEGYKYLNPEEAKRILVDSWNNPPSQTLGMIIPSKVNPYSFEGWGVVITYEADGHIDDEDAAHIDYEELMRQMKLSVDEENSIRMQEGYEPYGLTGWAEPPHYDMERHKLFWALELEFGEPGEAVRTLNYNVRILGRRGVLVFNAVSGIEQLQEVQVHMHSILDVTSFTSGNEYDDFNPETDHVAAYGVDGLIAGNVAANTSLLSLFLDLLLEFWKFIVVLLLITGFLLRQSYLRRRDVVG